MRRLLAVALVGARSRCPAVALGSRDASSTSPATQSRVDAPPQAVVLRFDQSVTITPRAIEVFTVRRDARSRARGQSTRHGRVVTRAARGPRSAARPTRCAGGRPPPTVTPARASSRSASASRRRRRPRRTARRARLDGRRRALGVLRLTRAAASGRSALRLLVLREPLPPRSRTGSTASPRRGHRGAQRRHRRLRDARGRCAAAAVRRPALRRSLADRDEDPLRGRVRRDDARLRGRHGARAAGLDPRPARACSGRHSSSGSGSRPGCRSPATRASSRTRRSSPELADWLHLVAAILWVGGLVALAACVWPLAPDAAARSISRLLAASRPCSSACSCSPAPISRSRGCRPCPTSGRRVTGRPCSSSSRSSALALGWGAAHHFFVRPRLERGEAPRGLRRSLIGESTVAIVVLLVAAVLVERPTAGRRTGGGGDARAATKPAAA